MSMVDKWIEKFDRMMTAITFAEAGQWETALDVLHEKPKKKRRRAGLNIKKQGKQRPALRL